MAYKAKTYTLTPIIQSPKLSTAGMETMTEKIYQRSSRRALGLYDSKPLASQWTTAGLFSPRRSIKRNEIRLQDTGHLQRATTRTFSTTKIELNKILLQDRMGDGSSI